MNLSQNDCTIGLALATRWPLWPTSQRHICGGSHTTLVCWELEYQPWTSEAWRLRWCGIGRAKGLGLTLPAISFKSCSISEKWRIILWSSPILSVWILSVSDWSHHVRKFVLTSVCSTQVDTLKLRPRIGQLPRTFRSILYVCITG